MSMFLDYVFFPYIFSRETIQFRFPISINKTVYAFFHSGVSLRSNKGTEIEEKIVFLKCKRSTRNLQIICTPVFYIRNICIIESSKATYVL